MQKNESSLFVEQALDILTPRLRRTITKLAKKSIRTHSSEAHDIHKRNELINATFQMKTYQKYGYVSDEFAIACQSILREVLTNETSTLTSATVSMQAA